MRTPEIVWTSWLISPVRDRTLSSSSSPIHRSASIWFDFMMMAAAALIANMRFERGRREREREGGERGGEGETINLARKWRRWPWWDEILAPRELHIKPCKPPPLLIDHLARVLEKGRPIYMWFNRLRLLLVWFSGHFLGQLGTQLQ